MDKTINDISLKSLTFQTGQTKGDEGSIYIYIYIYMYFYLLLHDANAVCILRAGDPSREMFSSISPYKLFGTCMATEPKLVLQEIVVSL